VSSLEESRDEAHRKYEDHKNTHESKAEEERQLHREALHKATSQAASLDGRLASQRDLLLETTQALMRCEKAEEQAHAELTAKILELSSEHSAARGAHSTALDQVEQEAGAREARFQAELESEEVLARRHARAEIDAASRSTLEAEERHRRLDAELAALRDDHGEVNAQHSRHQDQLRKQCQELKQKLADTEGRCLAHEDEVDKHKKDLEEVRLEGERARMAHRLEVERLQQTLEAEGQSRNAQDQISQSRLEEKDTLLEHRASAVERLEQELEQAKKKIAAHEETIMKTREEGDAKAHQLGVRNADLERELRVRQDRITEVEGRLDSSRSYMEHVTETLTKTQSEKDALMEKKGSLEAQLQLESSHKEAVSVSLQRSQEDAERRCKDLEERIQRDHEAHQEALEEGQRTFSEELRQSAERLSAIEAELLTTRQRCELLAKNKADLQQEAAEFQEKHANHQAGLAEHRANNERLGLELEQHRQGKETAEQELARVKEDLRQGQSRIEDLLTQVKEAEELRRSTCDDFSSKVQRLDDLLSSERKLREDTEMALLTARQDADAKADSHGAERRRLEQEVRETSARLETHRDKVEEMDRLLGQHREQLDVHKTRAENVDTQRREVEAQLRGESATMEAQLRRVEAEAQRAKAQVEDGKAELAQQKAQMTAKIAALQRQLDQEASTARSTQVAREAAEAEMLKHADTRQQFSERLGMGAEELFTRQVEFALEKQRLSGALEESRRTLRNSLGVPNPAAAIDSVRISGMEQQLAEERRKSIEQVVALQRTERRCAQLEEAQRRGEEQRQAAVRNSREVERKCVGLSEDLRKATIKLGNSDQRHEEVRERAAMTAAEMQTVRYEGKYEAAKLRGALDELRYMIKMQK